MVISPCTREVVNDDMCAYCSPTILYMWMLSIVYKVGGVVDACTHVE